MDGTFLAGIFSSSTASGLTLGSFLLCIAAALTLGAAFAAAYTYRAHYTKSFVVTLALLPAIVTVVIMMVSGSIGAGVAVAGTFSLVRFRSVPGTAREICAVFLCMAAGLATGMGYVGFACLFSLMMIVAWLLYSRSRFGEERGAPREKTLRITIPEDLDYGGVFDDLFAEYTSGWRLTSVRTSAMGSLYKLSYDIELRDPVQEKALIDALRCRNGNLEISASVRTAEAGL